MNHNIRISKIAAVLALVTTSGAVHAQSASQVVGDLLRAAQQNRVEHSPDGRACSARCGSTSIDQCAITCAQPGTASCACVGGGIFGTTLTETCRCNGPAVCWTGTNQDNRPHNVPTCQ